MEGVYAIFGERDIILRVRASSDAVIKQTISQTIQDRRWGKFDECDIFDAYRESYARRRNGDPIQMHAGLKTRVIQAFVEFRHLDNPVAFVDSLGKRLNNQMDASLSVNGSAPHVPVLLKACYTGVKNAVIEIVVPCGGFYKLADAVVQVKKTFANDRQEQFVTYLAYGAWTAETGLVQVANAIH